MALSPVLRLMQLFLLITHIIHKQATYHKYGGITEDVTQYPFACNYQKRQCMTFVW